MKEQINRLECTEQTWIDQYLLGELDDEALIKFESRLKSDRQFKETVELQRDLIAGIFLFEEDKTSIRPINKSRKRLPSAKLLSTILKLSAVFALLIASILLVSKTEPETDQTVTANLSEENNIEYPTEWAFGDVDHGEMAVLNDIPLYMDQENAMLFWHFFEFHNAIPN